MEEVLCVSRVEFERRYRRFHGYISDRTATHQVNPLFPNESVCRFIDREICETDPDWLQIVPYIVTAARSRDSGTCVLVYRRAKGSGESRLLGKSSVGVGGHINPVDHTPDLSRTILKCASREMSEELEVGHFTLRPLGVLCDGSNPVGSVHVGVVMLATLSVAEAKPKGEDMADVRFVPVTSLFCHENPELHGDFENWSRLLLTSGCVFRDGVFI